MSNGSTVLSAKIAMASPSLPAPRQILATLSRRFPDCPSEGSVKLTKTEIIFPYGGNMAVVAAMKGPILGDELEDACAAAWWWPQATARLRRHPRHAVVTLMGEHGTMQEKHVRLTHLVAAVARRAETLGIFWENGGIVHEPATFQRQVAALTFKKLVPNLWIDMRSDTIDEGIHRFYTNGMWAFGQLEIEVERARMDREELLDICYPTVRGILESGARIRHGARIVTAAGKKIRVTHGPSLFDPRLKVMKLDLE
jgi:hypothetical protein